MMHVIVVIPIQIGLVVVLLLQAVVKKVMNMWKVAASRVNKILTSSQTAKNLALHVTQMLKTVGQTAQVYVKQDILELQHKLPLVPPALQTKHTKSHQARRRAEAVRGRLAVDRSLRVNVKLGMGERQAVQTIPVKLACQPLPLQQWAQLQLLRMQVTTMHVPPVIQTLQQVPVQPKMEENAKLATSEMRIK
jgi:hypothetical protein